MFTPSLNYLFLAAFASTSVPATVPQQTLEPTLETQIDFSRPSRTSTHAASRSFSEEDPLSPQFWNLELRAISHKNPETASSICQEGTDKNCVSSSRQKAPLHTTQDNSIQLSDGRLLKLDSLRFMDKSVQVQLQAVSPFKKFVVSDLVSNTIPVSDSEHWHFFGKIYDPELAETSPIEGILPISGVHKGQQWQVGIDISKLTAMMET